MYFFTLENIKNMVGVFTLTDEWEQSHCWKKHTCYPQRKAAETSVYDARCFQSSPIQGQLWAPLPSSQKATETQRNIARIEKNKWMTDIYRSKKWKSIWRHNLYFLGYVASSHAWTPYLWAKQFSDSQLRHINHPQKSHQTQLRSQNMESYCVNSNFALSLQIWVFRQDSLTSVSHAPMTISTW